MSKLCQSWTSADDGITFHQECLMCSFILIRLWMVNILLTSSTGDCGDIQPFHGSFNCIIWLLRVGMHQFMKQFVKECLIFRMVRKKVAVITFIVRGFALRWRSLSWEECEIGAIIQNLLQYHRVYAILHNSISNIECSPVDWSARNNRWMEVNGFYAVAEWKIRPQPAWHEKRDGSGKKTIIWNEIFEFVMHVSKRRLLHVLHCTQQILIIERIA